MALRACLLLMLSAIAVPARAAPVTWLFEGVILDITIGAAPEVLDQLTSLGVEVGTPLTASFRFETTTPDARPLDPAFGQYPLAIDRQTLDVGAIHLDLALALPASYGSILVRAAPDTGVLISDVHSVDPTASLLQEVGIYLNLESTDPIFPNDSLPSVPPPLDALAPYGPTGLASFIVFSGRTAAGSFVTTASLTRLEAVPEPGAATLLGVTAVALAALRRCRG